MINMSRNFNGFGMMPYRPQRDVPDYALNKNSGGIDQYGEYLEQTYGDPDFDQKRDDFLQNVSQQEQQTFGGGMNSFAPSITRQPSLGRPMFQAHRSGPVIGSPFGGSVGSPSANKSLPSSPYESFFSNFNAPTFFQEGGSVSGPPPTHGPNANGVSNRGMFKNRDSRKKLAQMGGILSSSPELQETAMTFANGGGADLPDYIINVPGLTAEGEYLRISSATLEKLNNAVPEIMANASMVSPVDMVISEGFSSLVANARPGDAVVGTRVNRLREQRATNLAAAPDLAPVPIPPDTAEISSPTASTQDNLASVNGVDIETVQRIRDSDAKRSEAALLESLAPNNAQGQPGGILGAKYPEGRGSYSTSIAEALLNSDPFSGELSPSQTARNQETLSNTLRREEIAQQREDSTEAGRIMRDAADTREAFSVPLESGIAKAVPTEVDDEAGRLIQAERERILKLQALNKMQEPTVSPAEELQAVTGSSSVLSSAGEAIKSLLPDEFGFQRRQRERRELAEDKRFNQTGPATEPSTDELLEVASSILSDEQREAIASGKISDRAKALLPKQELFSEAPIAGTGQAGLAQKIRDESLTPEELKAALGSGAGDLTLEAAEKMDPGVTGALSFDPKIVPSAFLGEKGKEKRLENIQDRLDTQTLDSLAEIQRALPAKSGVAADYDQELAEEQVVDAEATLLDEIKRTSGPLDDPETKIPQVPKTVTEKITTLGENAGMGQGFGGDGSIADLTKDYTKLLKSLLGESDEDKAARKGELFMLMGAALMSGKSSNALTNIGNALQIGAKSAIQDRNTRKKREDTIGLKGLELAVAEEGRNEAARVRKKDRTQKLDDAKELALYRAGLKPAKEFLETPTGKLMKEVYVKILSDGLAQSQQLDVVRKNAFDALGTFSEDAQGAFRRAAMFAEQAVIGQSQTGSQDFAVDEETEG